VVDDDGRAPSTAAKPIRACSVGELAEQQPNLVVKVIDAVRAGGSSLEPLP
jgi:hypothetical protein